MHVEIELNYYRNAFRENGCALASVSCLFVLERLQRALAPMS